MKLVLITGGSRGLGLALCDEYTRRGYRVIDYSRTAPNPYSVSMDLSHPEVAQRTLDASLAALPMEGYEEILIISNAGILDPLGPSSKKPRDRVLANLNINFTTPIVLLSRIVAHFQTVRCRKILVTISSGAARKVYYGWSLYCAAKAGMEAYIETLALEQSREKDPFIPVIIDPGVIDTEMQAAIRNADPEDFPDVERFQRRKLEGGLAAPGAVAKTIATILSTSNLTCGHRYQV